MKIIIKCYNCDKLLNKYYGYYVIADWEYSCSTKCTKQMLSEEEYAQGEREWKKNGDSDVYYWTDWS